VERRFCASTTPTLCAPRIAPCVISTRVAHVRSAPQAFTLSHQASSDPPMMCFLWTCNMAGCRETRVHRLDPQERERWRRPPCPNSTFPFHLRGCRSRVQHQSAILYETSYLKCWLHHSLLVVSRYGSDSTSLPPSLPLPTFKPLSKTGIFLIVTQVKWLGNNPVRVTYSSDYFQQLYEFAIQLIKQGDAYVCHQTKAEVEYSAILTRLYSAPSFLLFLRQIHPSFPQLICPFILLSLDCGRPPRA